MSTETKQIKAIAAFEAKGTMKEFLYSPKPLGPKDVEIAVHACGVSGTDIHMINNDWYGSTYPLVPGREIIGVISALGSAVTQFRLGQRVGVGAITGTCGACRECVRGATQLCNDKKWSYGSPMGSSATEVYGGWATHTRQNSEWVFAIPDSLPTVGAAPLFEAGVTVWSPMLHNKIKAGDKVGIIGVGGLGHLAVKIARALGCNVTGISTSLSKKAEILSLGAHQVLNSNDAKEMAAAANSLDFILSTAVVPGINWDAYLTLLRPDSTIVLVGAPTVTFSAFNIVVKRLNIQGSLLASAEDTRSLLEFAAKHNITATTETLPMTPDGCNAALAKVRANTARYRMVLVNEEAIAAAAAATATPAAAVAK